MMEGGKNARYSVWKSPRMVSMRALENKQTGSIRWNMRACLERVSIAVMMKGARGDNRTELKTRSMDTKAKYGEKSRVGLCMVFNAMP